jgi:hypothetical protein
MEFKDKLINNDPNILKDLLRISNMRNDKYNYIVCLDISGSMSSIVADSQN